MVHTGVACVGHELKAIDQSPLQALVAKRGHCAAEECYAAVAYSAGWFAVSVAKNLAADGVGRTGYYASGVHGESVAPSAETIGAIHEHRVVRKGRGECVVCGIAVSPQAIVPAARDNPLARGYGVSFDMRNYARDRLCLVDHTF